VLGAQNNDYALQVSDRRTSRADGSTHEDESNKMILFESNACRFIVGFSGLAEAGDFRTGGWLAETLRDVASPDFTPDGIFRRLTDRATETFATDRNLLLVPPRHRRLSVMLTGFVSTTIGTLCSYAIMTNFQNFVRGDDDLEAWTEHRLFWRVLSNPPRPAWSVQRIGMWREFGTSEIDKIKALVVEGKLPEAVVGNTVEIIREIADRPSTAGLVGKQLMSAVIPCDFSKPGRFAYHTNVPQLTYYLPTIVAARPGNQVIISGATLTATGKNAKPFVFPKQHRNAPCQCGSGKKYKNCHGRI